MAQSEATQVPIVLRRGRTIGGVPWQIHTKLADVKLAQGVDVGALGEALANGELDSDRLAEIDLAPGVDLATLGDAIARGDAVPRDPEPTADSQ